MPSKKVCVGLIKEVNVARKAAFVSLFPRRFSHFKLIKPANTEEKASLADSRSDFRVAFNYATIL